MTIKPHIYNPFNKREYIICFYGLSHPTTLGFEPTAPDEGSSNNSTADIPTTNSLFNLFKKPQIPFSHLIPSLQLQTQLVSNPSIALSAHVFYNQKMRF